MYVYNTVCHLVINTGYWIEYKPTIVDFVILSIDVDECALNTTNPCEQNCTNTIGDFECSCFTGFNQTGFECDG